MEDQENGDEKKSRDHGDLQPPKDAEPAADDNKEDNEDKKRFKLNPEAPEVVPTSRATNRPTTQTQTGAALRVQATAHPRPAHPSIANPYAHSPQVRFPWNSRYPCSHIAVTPVRPPPQQGQQVRFGPAGFHSASHLSVPAARAWASNGTYMNTSPAAFPSVFASQGQSSSTYLSHSNAVPSCMGLRPGQSARGLEADHQARLRHQPDSRINRLGKSIVIADGANHELREAHRRNCGR
ncbi:hypothetical protein QBC44DRAFT_363796 [Cladorrhinum sp. PSN332]|nr:hypothetical protein QBC44DRAFT_363796 [Cladorrhinum sp. PSN332]